MDVCSSSQQSFQVRPTKPRLEEFLRAFQDQVIAVNEGYASSKKHLEELMAQYAKDGDDEDMGGTKSPMLQDEELPVFGKE